MTIEGQSLEIGQNFIGGAWQDAPETMQAVSPSTGATIGTLPRSPAETVREAIAAARAAAPGWAGTPVWTVRRPAWRSPMRSRPGANGWCASSAWNKASPLPRPTTRSAVGRGFNLAGDLVKYLGRRDHPDRGSGQAGDDVLPAARRLCRGDAVELPGQHPCRIHRAGARRRQHHGLDAGADDLADRGGADARHRGRRPAAGSSTWSPAPAPWLATRSSPIPGTDAVGFTGSAATGKQISCARPASRS